MSRTETRFVQYLNFAYIHTPSPLYSHSFHEGKIFCPKFHRPKLPNFFLFRRRLSESPLMAYSHGHPITRLLSFLIYHLRSFLFFFFFRVGGGSFDESSQAVLRRPICILSRFYTAGRRKGFFRWQNGLTILT